MAFLALVIALADPATHLSIEPWTGSDFQVTAGTAAKYRLEVAGKPNASVRLHAVGVASGWIAAFCTPRLCSPQHIDVTLPRSGQAVIQFELIRESDNAPKQSGATIRDNDGAWVAVPAATR